MMEGRLSGLCYSGYVLKTNLCQIVENVKNVKNDDIPFCRKCR